VTVTRKLKLTQVLRDKAKVFENAECIKKIHEHLEKACNAVSRKLSKFQSDVSDLDNLIMFVAARR
jgi:hypothetical protein